MAKKRMGRNLDALLGGASRERRPVSTTRSPADEPGPARSDGTSGSPEADVATAAAVRSEAAAAGAAGKRRTARQDRSSVIDLNTSSRVRGRSVPDQSVPDESSDRSATLAEDEVLRPERGDRLQYLGVDQIRRGAYQPRRNFDEQLLMELAESLKSEGMIQPIIVRPSVAGAFELVAGERRWRAAQLAGLHEIPAIIREMEDQSVAAVSLIENIQRKDLNPLEEAAAFARLCDEFGMTHKDVAEAVGRSRAAVSNIIRLLDLHDEVKVLVDRGVLEMGHARAILGAPREAQPSLATKVVKGGLTTRSVEKIVADMREGKPLREANRSMSDPDIERLASQLAQLLGAPVRINHRVSGAGKLEITYSTVNELQGILEHIK